LAKLAGIATNDLNKELLSRIAYNTTSSAIREKAMEKDMTTEKLVKWESSRVEQQRCNNEQTAAGEAINFVKNKRKANEGMPQPQSQKKKCGRCGYDYPHQGKCPADGKTCTNCKKLNHFASVCRQGQPPERTQASNNSGNWRNTQQSNSHNRSFTKKVYNVREGQEPWGQGIAHPDWPAFQKIP
jgi:hypothetical protein